MTDSVAPTSTPAVDPGPSPWRHPARIGYALIILTFGVMGGWAAVAPLDRAVVATGSVVVEDARKSIQHLEGGTVATIAVSEGQRVDKDQVVVRLSPTQAQSSLEIVRSQLIAEQALEARLVAEMNQADTVAYPVELELRSDASAVRSAINDQNTQFRERAATQAVQRKLLEARIEQSLAEAAGLEADKTSASRQLAFINQELVGLRELNAKGLASLNRLLTMERERTRLEGVIGRAAADAAKLASATAEARLQLSQLRQKFQEDASSALADCRKRLAELQEKFAVARDIMTRLDIRSPVSGTVQNLKVATIGQVIKPGEPLMEVAPDDARLVIHVHLPVQDIENVRLGQRAEIKFPGFHSRRTPLFEGTLRSISRDRLVEEKTQQPYYLGVVTVDSVGVAEPYRSRLLAGMPADVLIATGERTALSYLVSPLAEAIDTGFRN
ncbi:MAG: HlyD family type I secretion periplasmic adaptor subunit [Rhizobiales bacterium]|nr:HlyD family type I secretion periplasmic adaptor subunit [Hyphomicrobiales bacterium]